MMGLCRSTGVSKNQWRSSFKTLSVALLSVIAFLAGYSVRFLLDRDHIELHRREIIVDELNAFNRSTEDEFHIKSTSDFHDIAVKQISPGSIREYLKYFSSMPHLAGTKEDLEQAQHLEKLLKEFGFDDVEIRKYYALLCYPRVPGNLTIFDENGKEMRKITVVEKALDETEGDPREIYPFNAYTASGQAEGELVYGNYGSASDHDDLKMHNISLEGKIMILRYGKAFRGDKVKFAEQAGAKGVIFYSDPEDFNFGAGNGYPDTWFLPDTAVQRGNVLMFKSGDPLSPGYPSTEGSFRTKKIKPEHFAKIPVQPMNFRDAGFFLRQLDGYPIPDESWQGGLNFTYRITSKKRIKVRMNVDVAFEDRPIYNVIGKIYGSTEPDRMVLIGNHRDAWVYGAADPSSGTAAMMETARAFGAIKQQGWRPRRTLLVCSWDAEEYGLIGSIEYVEDYSEILRDRAVAYLNVDISVQGNFTLRLKSTPHLVNPFFDVVKTFPDPDNSNETLLQSWAKKTPNYAKTNEPRVSLLGSGSDFAPFYSSIGVPCVDFRFSYDEDASPLQSYPVYHTIHDNFKWMTKFVDPDFKYHAVVARLWTKFSLNLLDSIIIPYNLSRYCEDLATYIVQFEDNYRELFDKRGIDLDMLKLASREFTLAAAQFHHRLRELNKSDPFAVRMVNDQLMEVERAFIHADGISERPGKKHVLYSPSIKNRYLGRSFPGVVEAIFKIEYGTSNDWDQVQIQLAIVIHHIRLATKILQQVKTS